MSKKVCALFTLLFCMTATSVVAQITIAPIMLFLDQQNRFGTLLILNGSEQTQEVSIEFPFGYPVTNDTGNVEMVYDDSVAARQYGISDIIRGFPTNFTLQPGQRQVVRLTLLPEEFPNGTYWSRIRTTSTPQAPPIGETSGDEITTQITYRFEQVTTVFYKQGDVTTGLNIENVSTNQTENFVRFIIDLTRTGNSPFLGNINLTIRDSDGAVVEEMQSSTSIYFDYRQVFEIERERLPGGNYTAQFRMVTQRSDVPTSDLVQMQPVTRSINFTVN